MNPEEIDTRENYVGDLTGAEYSQSPMPALEENGLEEAVQPKDPDMIARTHHDELETILGMFGSHEARRNFEELISKYREIYLKSHHGGYDVAHRAEFGRSGTHNEIMHIL